jgi:hypothetical protein
MMHSDYMAKEAVLTVRVPASMKRQLEARAKQNRRSLSAQIATYLEQGLAETTAEPTPIRARILGRFPGGPETTDQDLAEVRALLRKSLDRRLERFR